MALHPFDPPDLATPGQPLPAQQHPALAYLAGLAPTTRRVMRSDLDTIARLLTGGRYDAASLGAGWLAVNRSVADAVRAQLLERYKPATVNRMLSALRGVIRKAWDLGYLTAEEKERINGVPAVRAESLPSGRDLTAGEIAALFDVCARDATPAGVRDAAILGVFNNNPRRAEVAALEVADYDPATGRLLILHGKGRKERAIYLDSGAMAALDAWLALRGDHAGALFHPVNKGGTIDRTKGMTAQALYLIVDKRRRQAGLAPFSCHDFRRTYVGDLLDAGADIVTVQKLVGHQNPATTALYDRRPEEAKRKAANLRRSPYRPPTQRGLSDA